MDCLGYSFSLVCTVCLVVTSVTFALNSSFIYLLYVIASTSGGTWIKKKHVYEVLISIKPQPISINIFNVLGFGMVWKTHFTTHISILIYILQRLIRLLCVISKPLFYFLPHVELYNKQKVHLWFESWSGAAIGGCLSILQSHICAATVYYSATNRAII